MKLEGDRRLKRGMGNGEGRRERGEPGRSGAELEKVAHRDMEVLCANMFASISDGKSQITSRHERRKVGWMGTHPSLLCLSVSHLLQLCSA